MLSPFMVAMAPEATVQEPQAPAAIYNWESQGAVDIISDEDGKAYAMGTWSYPPGMPGQPAQVDDTMLC